MSTSFPGSVDPRVNPITTDPLTDPQHSAQHADINDDIFALKTKLGADDSAVTTSIDYKLSQLPNRNRLYGSGATVIQRGAGPFTANGYSIDGWKLASSTSTISLIQYTTLSSISDVVPPGAFATIITLVGTTGAGNYVRLEFPVEDVRSVQGDYVFSVYAAYDDLSTPTSVSVEVVQNFGSGGSADVTSIGVTKVALESTATDGLTRIEVPVTIPSILAKTIGTGSYVSVYVWLDAGTTYNARTSSLGHHSSTIYMAAPQFEPGHNVTAYEAEHPQAALARCQRYYQAVPGNTVTGQAISTVASAHSLILPVSMRSNPTLAVTGSLTNSISELSATTRTPTSISVNVADPTRPLLLAAGMTGLTTNAPCLIVNAMTLTAEL